MMRTADPGDDKGQVTAAEVVGRVDDLLARAVQADASDVHFEPTAGELVVKYRLDGVLNVVDRLPKAVADNVVARLKVLAGLLTYRNDIPQEGRIEVPPDPSGKVADQRVAVFPTIHGQRAVVRLFYQNQDLADLGRLGLSPAILGMLQSFAAGSQGVLLVTGPAGSGKSTTLAALLRTILDRFPGRSIVTLEDPVEIRIDGATQVQISPHAGMTFPVALRSLLRQDPQVLMIGEIRDADTAGIVVEAGLTGHLLASTMHSGTPAGAIVRLLEMGIEPYQVTSSIWGVVNQRLVRRLCPDCKRRTGAGLFEPVGCDRCLGTGFKGRVLIAEAIQLDCALRRAILARADAEELQSLVDGRGRGTLAQDGRRLVQEGQTTQDELAGVIGTAPS
ncbi:MAG: type II/IV secretion system protein [Phycisphaerae bacterium]|nr:type II/IV secretion system protein [Phycisphaerae bacterium]